MKIRAFYKGRLFLDGGLFGGGLFGGVLFVGGLFAGGLFPGRPFWSYPLTPPTVPPKPKCIITSFCRGGHILETSQTKGLRPYSLQVVGPLALLSLI